MEPRARPPRDVPTAILQTLKEECNVNPQSWILLTLDGGNQSTFASPHLEKHKTDILGDQVQHRFRKAHEQVTSCGNIIIADVHRGRKRRAAFDDDIPSGTSTPKGPRKKARKKEPRAGPESLQRAGPAHAPEVAVKDFADEIDEGDVSEPEAEASPPGYVEEMRIRIDDGEKVHEFIKSKFSEMLQLATKTIAKAWIKEICPSKQSKYPYNPGKSRKDGQSRGACAVKIPPWWPVDTVRFKEPDHLHMDERMNLVLHLALLRDYPGMAPEGPFTASRKRGSTDSCVFDKPWARRCLDELLRVLERLEAYELGEIDGDTRITVRMYRRHRRRSNLMVKRERLKTQKADTSSSAPVQSLHGMEADDDAATESDTEVEGGLAVGDSFDFDQPHFISPTSNPALEGRAVSGRAARAQTLSGEIWPVGGPQCSSNFGSYNRMPRRVLSYPLPTNGAKQQALQAQGRLQLQVPPLPEVGVPSQQGRVRTDPQSYTNYHSAANYFDPFSYSSQDPGQTSDFLGQDPLMLQNQSFPSQQDPLSTSLDFWGSDPITASNTNDGDYVATATTFATAGHASRQPFSEMQPISASFESTMSHDFFDAPAPPVPDWNARRNYHDPHSSMMFRTVSLTQPQCMPSYDGGQFPDYWHGQ